MKRLHFALLILSLLLLTACDDTPETAAVTPEVTGISQVGSHTFDRYPGSSDTEKLLLPEKFLTENDVLELYIAPVSRMVWRIDLIIPEVPGSGDALAAVKSFVEEHFNLTFADGDQQLLLPESKITLDYAYGYGTRAVRCSFIDLANEKIFLAEDSSGQAADIRRRRQARQDILLLENALYEFELDTGTYPDDLDGLLSDPGISGWRGPYTDTIPRDPWGNAYTYRKNQNSFEIKIADHK